MRTEEEYNDLMNRYNGLKMKHVAFRIKIRDMCKSILNMIEAERKEEMKVITTRLNKAFDEAEAKVPCSCTTCRYEHEYRDYGEEDLDW